MLAAVKPTANAIPTELRIVRLLPYSRVPLWPSRWLNLASILYFGTLASFAHQGEIVAAPAPGLQAHIVVSSIHHPSVDRANEVRAEAWHEGCPTLGRSERMSCCGRKNSPNVPLRKAAITYRIFRTFGIDGFF
jgi:hypothetical protein